VLIASDAITTTALIDVGSYRSSTASFAGVGVGAGANPRSCSPGTPLPSMTGGYAGGSFLGVGGIGGPGSDGGSGGSPASAVTGVSGLRGGCPAQTGNAVNVGGYGGGAVFLIAGTRIDLHGGINAAGAGGRGAGPGIEGGFGGGSGGM